MDVRQRAWRAVRRLRRVGGCACATVIEGVVERRLRRWSRSWLWSVRVWGSVRGARVCEGERSVVGFRGVRSARCAFASVCFVVAFLVSALGLSVRGSSCRSLVASRSRPRPLVSQLFCLSHACCYRRTRYCSCLLVGLTGPAPGAGLRAGACLFDPPLHIQLGVEIGRVGVPVLDALPRQQLREHLDVARIELRAGDPS